MRQDIWSSVRWPGIHRHDSSSSHLTTARGTTGRSDTYCEVRPLPWSPYKSRETTSRDEKEHVAGLEGNLSIEAEIAPLKKWGGKLGWTGMHAHAQTPHCCRGLPWGSRRHLKQITNTPISPPLTYPGGAFYVDASKTQKGCYTGKLTGLTEKGE